MDLSKIIRAALAGLAATALLAGLGACATTPSSGVEAGDGPNPSQAVEGGGAGEDQEAPMDDVNEVEPSEGASEEAPVANFEQKYTYPDGVEVEVIKIERGKISKAAAELAEPSVAGDPWIRLTVRVKNGTKKTIDAYSSAVMSYGPDGESAESPYLSDRPDDEDISGKILPGRSKTGSDTFVIPIKHQNDPVLEFSFDGDHEAAIFTGPVNQ